MTYHAPTSLAEALQVRKSGARVVAGGTDFYPLQGDTLPNGPLLDLSRVRELAGIAKTGDGWRIGATTTWAQIASAELPPAFRALRQAAREVGAIQIQNAATIAGNLCNASPAADGVPPLLVLDAEVELARTDGLRRLPLSRFLTGPRETGLRPDELMTAIHLPDVPEARSAFLKLGSRRYLVISIVMVAVQVEVEQDRIVKPRVAVGACSPVARRLSALEAALDGRTVESLRAPGVVHASHLDDLSPIDDVRADAGYRLEAAGEMIRRSILAAVGVSYG